MGQGQVPWGEILARSLETGQDEHLVSLEVRAHTFGLETDEGGCEGIPLKYEAGLRAGEGHRSDSLCLQTEREETCRSLLGRRQELG